MNKIILIAFGLLLTSATIHAQFKAGKPATDKERSMIHTGLYEQGKYNNMPPYAEEVDYLKKSRNQKTTGWCFMGAGVIGVVVGLASFPKNGDILFASDEENAKADRATVITSIGSGLLLGSIPFFILSNVNKRKAKISVSSQSTGFGVPSTVSKTITGISLSLPIGK